MKAAGPALAVLALALSASAHAQAPPPAPGPEHEILKRDVGVWDATLEMSFPGAPPMTMSGVETNTLMGGRWLVTRYESEMMGQPFEGRGIIGWDPSRKAYVTVWADTMSTQIVNAEMAYDTQADKLTGWTEMVDPMGGLNRVKTEETWPSEGTRIVKFFGPDGSAFMTFTYKKRD